MQYPSNKFHITLGQGVRLLCLSLLATLLAACSTVGPEIDRYAPGPDAHLITVPLDDTIAALEAYYNGTVIITNDTHAVLRVTLSPEDFVSLGKSAEKDTRSFVAGSQAWLSGHSTAWAGGHSTAWAGGRSSAWAGGEFVWMPENTKTWQQINLEAGQNLSSNLGLDITVAIIDTGVDLSHPALSEALAPQDQWYDFVDDDMLPQELGLLGEGGYGHGTNVAGIVRQIAPRATILPIRVLGPDGSGYISHIVAGINHAVQQGADVINLSLGSKQYSGSVEVAIINAFKQGVLVVASTGNTADNRVTYPAVDATWQRVGRTWLSVTSVDAQDNKSSFATYGWDVELAAPGEDIYGPAPGLQVAGWSGTSMAAPIVSGVLALALGETTGLQARDLEKMIKVYSSNHYDNQNQDYLEKIGRGRVDVAAFMQAVLR